MKNIFIYSFFSIAFISCSDGTSYKENRAVVSADAPVSAMEYATTETIEDTKQPSEATIIQKIIKEANLQFEATDMEAAYKQIQNNITKHKATIQNDKEGKNYYSVFREMVIRIPSENFDAFINDIGKGVSYFDVKEISARDVTEEYIDTETRLKTKKALESRYLELLKKANKVSEILEIEKNISDIREEIEAKEGQLRYLQSKISQSTVYLKIYKTVAQEPGARISYGSKMGNAVLSGFNGISSFFIELLTIWPIIIFIIAIIYIIRKRIKRKKA